MRTNATDFMQSWQDYMAGIIAETEPNQITKGGPVIGTAYSDVPSVFFNVPCLAVQVGMDI